jgi:hypothetical protein
MLREWQTAINEYEGTINGTGVGGGGCGSSAKAGSSSEHSDFGTDRKPYAFVKRVVLGSPGIGKSTSLIVAFLYAMSEGVPVVMDVDARQYLFRPVMSASTSGGGGQCVRVEVTLAPVHMREKYWYFVDSKVPVTPSMRFTHMLFLSSPDAALVFPVLKEAGVLPVCMPVWLWDEILLAFNHIFETVGGLSMTEVVRRFQMFGGVPRQVLESVASEEAALKAAIAAAAEHGVAGLVGNMQHKNSVSHRVLHLYPCDFHPYYYLQPATQWVSQELMVAENSLAAAAARRFILESMGIPAIASTGGVVFESLVHRWFMTAGGFPNGRLQWADCGTTAFTRFPSMNVDVHGTVRFQYFTSNQPAQLATLEAGCYHIPIVPNYPVLDAIYYPPDLARLAQWTDVGRVRDSDATLSRITLFQMTTAASHGIAYDACVDILAAVDSAVGAAVVASAAATGKRNIPRRLPPVHVDFVFVITDKQSAYQPQRFTHSGTEKPSAAAVDAVSKRLHQKYILFPLVASGTASAAVATAAADATTSSTASTQAGTGSAAATQASSRRKGSHV